MTGTLLPFGVYINHSKILYIFVSLLFSSNFKNLAQLGWTKLKDGFGEKCMDLQMTYKILVRML